jgi:transposase, mutator family
MYAKGMTIGQISEIIEDIKGFEASEGFISDVTDKFIQQIEDWKNHPLQKYTQYFILMRFAIRFVIVALCENLLLMLF